MVEFLTAHIIDTSSSAWYQEMIVLNVKVIF